MKRDPEPNRYAEYEARKWAWLGQNPDCSSEEYARACRQIADELGI